MGQVWWHAELLISVRPELRNVDHSSANSLDIQELYLGMSCFNLSISIFFGSLEVVTMDILQECSIIIMKIEYNLSTTILIRVAIVAYNNILLEVSVPPTFEVHNCRPFRIQSEFEAMRLRVSMQLFNGWSQPCLHIMHVLSNLYNGMWSVTHCRCFDQPCSFRKYYWNMIEGWKISLC